MALGNTKSLSPSADQGIQVTRPVQIASEWTVIHTQPRTFDGGSDGAVNTRPDNVSSVGNAYVTTQGKGTSLVLMHRYNDAEAAGTSPIVNVFGRSSSSDPWCRLKNKSDSIDITLSADFTNDIEDGTYAYTTPDADDHMIDLLGCDQILVSVKTQTTLYAGGLILTQATAGTVGNKAITEGLSNCTVTGGDGSTSNIFTGGANASRNVAAVAASAFIDFTDRASVDETIVLTSADGTAITYTCKGSSDFGENEFSQGDSGVAETSPQELGKAIEHADGHNGKILVSTFNDILAKVI